MLNLQDSHCLNLSRVPNAVIHDPLRREPAKNLFQLIVWRIVDAFIFKPMPDGREIHILSANAYG